MKSTHMEKAPYGKASYGKKSTDIKSTTIRQTQHKGDYRTHNNANG